MSEPEKTIIDLARERNIPKGDEPKTAPRPQMRRDQESEASDIKDAISDLLKKVESKKGWSTIELPTRGVFNNGIKEVRIRPFTYEDERILRSVTKVNDGVRAVSTLMERCVEGIPYEELSLYDKQFLLFKLREISYGNEYPVEIECRSCGEENSLAVELDKLGVNYVDPDLEHPTPVFLPDSEVTAYVKCPRAKDEAILSNPAALTDALWKFVEKIETYNDRGVIQGFLTKTTAKDITKLRQSIFSQGIGLNLDVRFVCKHCGADELLTLPINESFFSVS
jgi:hypothetical protein